MEKMQIGWYILPEAKDFYNDYECAAWWEKVHIEAGRYPLYVYDRTFTDDGELRSNGAYTHMEGVLVSDNKQSLFYGCPIGEPYDEKKNAGKPASHGGFYYLFSIAEDVLNVNHCRSGRFELLPEYEAKEIRFVSTYDGKEKTTYGIFKKNHS